MYSGVCLRFLPPFFPEHVVVATVINVGKAGMAEKVNGKNRLDFASWQAAWDRHSLAAAATKMMPFESCMRHKHNVLEIVANGRADKYTSLLGVCYDEVARHA